MFSSDVLSLFLYRAQKLTISLISIYKYSAIDIADPSSMQDACHMNFVISLVGAYVRTLELGVRTTDRWATANISPPHSVLETKKLQAKVLDSTFPTIFV